MLSELSNMIKFLAKLSKYFFIDIKELEYQYLCGAVDRIDLENRMREVQQGKAPFQR